ncbi:MAG: YdbL family protein [Candidatus Omnitrophota bacterium]
MRIFKAFLLLTLVFTVGCATVKMKAPSEPIKVDISMRLDVYQHVQNDIDAIESIVSGSGEAQGAGDHSFLSLFVKDAYAEDLSSRIEKAALRRKARHSELSLLQGQGVVGESNAGLVVVRKPGEPSADRLVADENSDRMIIYNEIASKNGTSVASVQKLYAQRLQGDAAAGTPIQSESGGWTLK